VSAEEQFNIAEAELIWPGTWLDCEDRQLDAQVTSLLRVLESTFDDALLALLMFKRALDESAASRLADWDRDVDRREAAETAAWHGKPDPSHVQDREAARRLTIEKRIDGERLLSQWLWADGHLPTSVEHHLPFVLPGRSSSRSTLFRTF
jgi:hypothetical protein